MSQYLLPSGEDEKKVSAVNILRTINNPSPLAKKAGEDKYKVVTLQNLKENRAISQAFDRVEMVCKEAEIIKHGKKHAEFVAQTAGEILRKLGFSLKDVNMAEVAGYLHDLGYRLEIDEHALVSAGMAYERLREMNMAQEEIDKICLAIGSHNQAIPSNIAAALVIAEVADFGKSRVREGTAIETLTKMMKQTVSNTVSVNDIEKIIILNFKIEFQSSAGKKEFLLCQKRKFELCREAAKYLKCSLEILINDEEM